jgi:hypothetical protein
MNGARDLAILLVVFPSRFNSSHPLRTLYF